MEKLPLNIKREVAAIYNGIKRNPGDRDNLGTEEHEFIVTATGHTYRYKNIKLLQFAKPVRDKQYQLGFEDDEMHLLISISYDGILFFRETSNRIVSIDQKGNKINHSARPFITSAGNALRAHNLKLKAEGKPTIKPIKRKW